MKEKTDTILNNFFIKEKSENNFFFFFLICLNILYKMFEYFIA